VAYADGYHRTEDARIVDKLLSRCELISALYARGALSLAEMMHFEYNLRRIFTNRNVGRYFAMIDG